MFPPMASRASSIQYDASGNSELNTICAVDARDASTSYDHIVYGIIRG